MTGSLWVDKYAPSSLDELTFHPSVNESLSTLVILLLFANFYSPPQTMYPISYLPVPEEQVK